jgi:hypothetical protein
MTEPAVRLAELMAALSLATDLGMGQPVEFAWQSCVVAMRLGQALKFSDAELRGVYCQSLLRTIGCNAETRLLAAVFGDELALRADIIHADSSGPEFRALSLRFIREAHAGANPLQMLTAVVGGLAQMTAASHEFFEGHCEVAGRLAERLGFEPELVAALRQVYARWDGRGTPALKGEAVAPGMLAVSLAQDAVYLHRLGGRDATLATVKKRSGTLYAPAHVEVFGRLAGELLADDEPDWQSIVALEPGRRRGLTPAEFDAACAVIADYADIKSPYLVGHSPGVARLAEDAARNAGLPEADATPCGGRGCCTTWAGWAYRPAFGASRGRSPSASGQRCGCTPTIPSASWPGRRPWPSWGRWRRSTTGGWMAAAIIARPRPALCRPRRGCWPPPTSIRRSPSPAPIARRTRPRPRPRCSKPKLTPGGSTRKPCRRCWPPPGRASRLNAKNW